jgi:hypothetical protein
MSSVVYKYKLDAGLNTLQLPVDSISTTVGLQGCQLVLWVLVQDVAENLGILKPRTFYVAMTGEVFGMCVYTYVGTVQAGDGIVLHVFEVVVGVGVGGSVVVGVVVAVAGVAVADGAVLADTVGVGGSVGAEVGVAMTSRKSRKAKSGPSHVFTDSAGVRWHCRIFNYWDDWPHMLTANAHHVLPPNLHYEWSHVPDWHLDLAVEPPEVEHHLRGCLLRVQAELLASRPAPEPLFLDLSEAPQELS